MSTAQDRFKTMMRDHVAPALRDVGLTGSGQTYTLRSEIAWALVGLQKSAWSDRASLKFTVNVKVVSKEAWEAHRVCTPHRGRKPSSNTGIGSIAWEHRLGNLMPGGQDHWWTLAPSTDPEVLSGEVVHAIRTYALPRMLEQVEALRAESED